MASVSAFTLRVVADQRSSIFSAIFTLTVAILLNGFLDLSELILAFFIRLLIYARVPDSTDIVNIALSVKRPV